MIPFAMSFEDYVSDEEGVLDEYTYRLMYTGKMYYVQFPMSLEEMSVLERQTAVVRSFAEAFSQEQREKLDERPSDVQDTIDDTLAEYGLLDDDGDDAEEEGDDDED